MSNNEQTKIRRLHKLHQVTAQYPSSQQKENQKVDNLVTVRVPSAGGGFTSTQIPRSYLNKYLQSIGQEYKPLQIYTISDPQVLEKAKSEHPERYADPINNALNWAMFGGAGVARLGFEMLTNAGKSTLTGLKTAGQAVTPSTWIGGVAQATGYQAPTWLLNGADLAASAYYANEAGKDIDKNGLTWKTGFNALMSLAPMTRETEAIEGVANTLRRPTQAVSSVVDDFRAARNAVSNLKAVVGREFNRSVKNTRFVNVPVEHVSPNGMTKGSALDVGAEGIHLSPIGSSTTTNIQRTTGYPFVRTGTWTFSNNTRPVEVQDMGYFGKGFNPDFDSKVQSGITNFSYTNNFEGNGNQSFLTTEPSFGLQLSKNTQNSRINWDAPAVKTSEGLRLVDSTITPDLRGTLYNYLGLPSKSFNYASIKSHPEWGKGFSVQKYSQNGRDYYIGENSNRSKVIYRLPEESDFRMIEPTSEQDYWRIRGEIEDAILTSRHRFIESLPDNEIKDIVRSQGISKEADLSKSLDNSYSIKNTRLGDILQSKVENDIQDVYLSDKYITRYMESNGISPENRDFREFLKKRISYDLYKTYNKALPIFYRARALNGGVSNASVDYFGRPVQFRYGINGNTLPDYIQNDWTSILFHEFGHNIFQDTTPFSKYIQGHSATLRRNYPLEFTKPEYILQSYDPNTAVGYLSNQNEFRQRVMEGVRYGIKEGLTPEEIYNECNVLGFTELKPYFKKDYLIKMLGLMLGTTPVIVNSKNNDKSN